jgi:bacteriocin-like protein
MNINNLNNRDINNLNNGKKSPKLFNGESQNGCMDKRLTEEELKLISGGGYSRAMCW